MTLGIGESTAARLRPGKWWRVPPEAFHDTVGEPPEAQRRLADGLDHAPDSGLPRFAETALNRATQALLEAQRDDGHWVFELEADATIPAEYVLLTHYLGEPDQALEQRMAVYLRRVRTPGGGWPLNHGGIFDTSASVKAYMALKAVGDAPSAPHMVEARQAILAHGGAEQANVFTRFLLALFGELPWSSVPVTPVEIMYLPRRFPIHLSRISYWGRTVVVPLLVLYAIKPLARNPRQVSIDELFVTKPGHVKPTRRAGERNDPGNRRDVCDRRPDAPATSRRSCLGCSHLPTRCCVASSDSFQEACAAVRSTRQCHSCANGSTAISGSVRSSRQWPSR